MRPAATGQSRVAIELQRRFRASPERLFRAWTQPDALREWWCPAGWAAGDVEIDLRTGGAYRIEMRRAGAGGGIVSVSGRFLEVRPPERLVFTWRWHGAFAEMPETLVTLELRGSESETLLTLRHDHFTDLALRRQHRGGWLAACERLEQLMTPPRGGPAHAI